MPTNLIRPSRRSLLKMTGAAALATPFLDRKSVV